MSTDVAIGTTISIVLAIEAKHSAFYAQDLIKNCKISVTVVHRDKLIARETSI